jgi:hypothetical protein
MQNIEEKIFDKVCSELSFRRVLMPSIMDENVRSKGIDHILLPTMNQIIFNINRNLVSGIKRKFK